MNFPSGLSILLFALCALAPRRLACAKAVPLCGRVEISSALDENEIAWVRRTSPEPRYKHCKSISARYNCTRFHTSAGDYRLGWKSGTTAECSLPTWGTVLGALQTTPQRVMLLGDSHTQQLYQAALCMFQEQARHVIAYIACDEKGGVRNIYAGMKAMPECHAVHSADYARFFLDAGSGDADACKCSLNHAPTTPSCFDVQLRDDPGTFSRVCSAYARPLVGAAAVHTGLFLGLASLNMSLSDFDVLAVNTYMSASELGAFLAEHKFAGRVLTYPKFTFGVQKGLVLTKKVLHKPIKSREVARLRVTKFCAAIRKTWSDAAGECTAVNFGRLMLQRNDDSKASIYPMSYVDAASGETRVCHANQGAALAHPELCDHKGVFACTKMPCAKESHFCLPGPPDDFALLLLSAAL